MALRARTRLVLTLVALGLGLAAVAGRLAWVQVVQRDEVLAKSYIDQETLQTMDRLLARGVFKPTASGRVLVDEAALALAVAQPATRQRLLFCAARARLYPGDKKFDPRLVRVLAPGKRPGRAKVVRGRILDRLGRPLALSRLDQSSGVQRRSYPLGPAAQQVLGFHHPVFGDHGLEAALNPVLTRHDPTMAGPEPLPGLGQALLGTDVRLTIDRDLQKRVFEALGQRPGAVVIMDTTTGGILAAVGSPAFDPNQSDHTAWRTARRRDQGKGLRCKPWGATYPPGSTFKLVVAAAWLEHNLKGKLPDPVIMHSGRDPWLRIRDIKAYGRVDFKKALYKSCNVYFARLGLTLGPEVPKMAVRFGFNQPLQLLPLAAGLSLKTQPSLAYANWRYRQEPGTGHETVTRRLIKFTTYKRDPKIVAQCAIGQNLVAATPLQMALVAQAIANDGVLMLPRLVAGIGNPANQKAYRPQGPMSGGRIMSQASAARLRQAMRLVMTQGTGRRAGQMLIAGRPLEIAGKTGTAETGREGEEPHAWFVGFAPAGRPRVAIAVILENGGLGSKNAAPLGVRLLGEALGAKPAEVAGKKPGGESS